MPRKRKKPGWLFGEVILQRMEKLGLTDQALADKCESQRSSITQLITGSKRQVSASLIAALARELSLGEGLLLRLKEERPTPADLHNIGKEGVVSDRPEMVMMTPRTEVASADAPEIRYQDMPQNVPVHGSGAGGDEGIFILNGEISEYVRRPPGIATAAQVFAIWLTGDSMWPRYSNGDLLYIHPGRRPKIGDDVLIELQPTIDGARPAFVKRLLKRNSDEVLVEQFNPMKQFVFDPKTILYIYPVLTVRELMGI